MNWRVMVGLWAVLGVGGLGYWYSQRSPLPVAPPKPASARTREAIQVPSVPFVDVTAAAGIAFRHTTGAFGAKLLPETMGGGVAVIDYDSDGRPDLLFINSCPWPGHPQPADGPATLKLYRNTGEGRFADVTEAVGLNISLYGMGAAIGDYDNDGHPDIFIACVGQHRLFRNINGQRFEDVTTSAGVGGPGQLPNCSPDEFLNWAPPIPFGASATFLDYDRDGKLDLFVCQYVTWSPAIDRTVGSTLEGGKRAYVQPRDFDGSYCLLFRNVDGQRFEDVSRSAGIQVSEREGTDATARVRAVGKSLGVVVCDPDGDGWPDIVVANDTVRNFFFHNIPGPNGERMFRETGYPIGVAYADEGKPRGGMGIDVGDYLPGRCGVVIANFANEPLTLLRQDKPTKLMFADAALSVGLAGPSRAALKFGTCFLDYDNDGRLDLLVCNGHIEPEIATIQKSQQHAQPAQLYWNTGRTDTVFEPVTATQAGPDLFQPIVGRGCAYLDYDGDGDLDLVLVANGGNAKLFRNDGANGRSLRLNLQGDGLHSNRSAIGAEVIVTVGGQQLRRTITGARGYLSQPDLMLTIGVGTATQVESVSVRWPDRMGTIDTWTNLATDQLHTLRPKAAVASR